MICSRCLLRPRPVALRLSTCAVPSTQACYSKPATSSQARPFSISNAAFDDRVPIPADKVEHSTPRRSPPAATSTSAAQPFSTPNVPSPKQAGTPTQPSDPKSQPGKKSTQPAILSSVSAGTLLRNLNYFKNKPDPVAMEDSEYPPWLWTVLSEKKKDYIGAGREEMDPRLFAKSAKARRVARKRVRQNALQNPESLKKKTPLYAQSMDLPGGESAEGVEQGADARLELRKAMRSKRRNDIKEANFLQGMR